MNETITITKAKARLSEIINRLVYQKSKIVVTKKGKRVAVILPFETYQNLQKGPGQGLILAKKSLSGLDREIDEMCDLIYREREKERSREVSF